MRFAVRHEDGRILDKFEWNEIRASTKALLLKNFRFPIPQHMTVKNFKASHREEWLRAVMELEDEQPLLKLCSSHYKADHLLTGVLTYQLYSTRKPSTSRRLIEDDGDSDDSRQSYSEPFVSEPEESAKDGSDREMRNATANVKSKGKDRVIQRQSSQRMRKRCKIHCYQIIYDLLNSDALCTSAPTFRRGRGAAFGISKQRNECAKAKEAR